MKKQTKRPPRKNEGRPLIKFDDKKWKDFEQLCALQCTKIEITGWLDVDDKTLDKLIKDKYKTSYSEIYRTLRGKGYTSLRRSNFKLAAVNASMAIFLSKNYLLLKDKTEVELSGSLMDKYRSMTKEEREAEWKRLDKEKK